MTTTCQSGSIGRLWWHVRLIYTLLCALVVIYGCSISWLLTTRTLDTDCFAQGRDPSTAVDQVSLGRARRSVHRRRASPAFYRDSNSRDGNTVDSDEWVWMSTYSKIPVSTTPVKSTTQHVRNRQNDTVYLRQTSVDVGVSCTWMIFSW